MSGIHVIFSNDACRLFIGKKAIHDDNDDEIFLVFLLMAKGKELLREI